MFGKKPPLTYENAFSRAAGMCAKCEQCSTDILKKLSLWGVSMSDSTKIIKKLKELNFLDDNRFAKAYTHDKLHFSGWGKNKIRQGLWAKRIHPDIIEKAFDEIEDDEYIEITARVILNKIKSTGKLTFNRESKIKLIKFAMQRGFEYSIIADIIRTRIVDTDR